MQFAIGDVARLICGDVRLPNDRDLIATFPVSKEAEEAKKLLPKEDRLAAEAEAGKIKDAAVIPDATAKPDAPKADNSNNNEANK